jgi:hypothetical protein
MIAHVGILQHVEASLSFEHVLELQEIVSGLSCKPLAPLSAQNSSIAKVPDIVLHLAAGAGLQHVEPSFSFEHVLELQAIMSELSFKPLAPLSAQNALIAEVPDIVLHLAPLQHITASFSFEHVLELQAMVPG